MKAVLWALIGVFVTSAVCQGLPPFRQVPIQRRQLTNTQQNHILTDIQQHQHRFQVHQNQNQPQQSPRVYNPNFQQQTAITHALPVQRQVIQNTRFQQQHTFRALPANPQTVAQAPQKQTLFQRSVQNQVGNFQGFNPFQQQQQFNDFGGQNRPVAAPLIQQPPLVQQNQPFVQPGNQVRFPNSQQQVFGQKNQFQAQTQSEGFQPNNGQFQQQQQPNAQFLQQNFNQQRETFLQPSQSLPQQQRQNVFVDTRAEEERQRELKERQKLIEKHEKFAQKQYLKQQKAVQQLHEEFVKKQQRIQEQAPVVRVSDQQNYYQNQNYHQKGRIISSEEQPLFEKSLKQYFEVNPTTTTTTTTPAPATTYSPSSVIPLKSKNKKTEIKTIDSDSIKLLLQGQRDKLFSQLIKETEKGGPVPSKARSTKALGRDELLKQLKQALADSPEELGDKNFTSMDLVLPNGEKVQVIRTSDPELIRKAKAGNNEFVEQIAATTTSAPLSFADLASSGILPAGANFEVVKQSANGDLTEVHKVPSQKKVTFVYLEEQDDGSYKVQGVKGEKDKEAKTSGSEVDSILKRIKAGEIQLPPPSAKVARAPTGRPDDDFITVSPNSLQYSHPSTVSQTVIPLSTPNHHHHRFNSISRSSTSFPKTAALVSTTPNYDDGKSPYSTLPNFAASQKNYYTVTPKPRISSTESDIDFSSSNFGFSATTNAPSYESSPLFSKSSSAFTTASPLTTLAGVSSSETQTTVGDLTNILRNNGLFAMSKYLKQSGLDSILNETGPYTIFVPTDKAFKSLLVQLGGPEKAEEKFKNNPRLLSGLLLHHVIPGSFEISSLQDEMTGVSLAGTQLRVNQYNMQDAEWNDVKVTTINGATIVKDKEDIQIPQGVAHAVDRVMFPLPVGDLLQTMQSDRERRFTQFLRAIFASGISDSLQNKGVKTFTIFAPTDAAFAHLTPAEITTMVEDKDSAEELVNKHILPGTLFTSGMRFYQVKETIAEDKTVTVQKNGGKVKVNEGTIISSNIPATNGVIHAIDSLL